MNDKRKCAEPHQYTPEELEFVKSNFHTMTKPSIAKALNLTLSQVEGLGRKLGLRKQLPKEWTDADREFMIANYRRLTKAELAKRLGASYNQVDHLRRQLNLRNYRHVKWSKEDEALLLEHYTTKGSIWCGHKLGRAPTAVQKKAASLGLSAYSNAIYKYECDDGYYMLCEPRRGRKSTPKIAEHRYIMEKKLGRKLLSSEIVHHIDGDKKNNHPDNLELTNREEHARYHTLARHAARRKLKDAR